MNIFHYLKWLPLRIDWNYEKCQQNQQFWECVLNALTVWRINWPFRLFKNRFQYKPLGLVFTHSWLYCLYILPSFYLYLPAFSLLVFFQPYSSLSCNTRHQNVCFVISFPSIIWEYKIRQGRKTGYQPLFHLLSLENTLAD